ncbi:MAG: DNA recombination protein RmuC [Patescibacteria group bacterium]|nr:DNA recombination protein RmuC [Patescibacteria group bacterium]
MQTLLIITIIGIFAVLAALVALLIQIYGKKSRDLVQDTSLESLKCELKDIRQEMKGSLEKNLEFIQKQSGESGQIIKEVVTKMEQLHATNKEVAGFATQLQGLENIMRNPKHRGIWGEYALETLLGNILPVGCYKMQYAFKNGDIVDAVIFVQNKVIPIDAKFSLEKFNRLVDADEKDREILEKDFKKDIKLRIDETSKYIKPSEGTTEFAFMFIPAEGVYHNLLNSKVGSLNVSSQDLIEYAFSKKVIIVSPTSFFAYLQTVIQALNALKVEESVKDVLKKVANLQKHIVNYEEYMRKMGNHLGTTVNAYNTAYKEFGKIDKDVAKLSDSEIKVDPMKLDRPAVD